MLGKLNRYLIKFRIFLIMAALIAGVVGCDNYNPPPTQNLEIRTWYDLDAVRNNLDGSYILMNDLDSTTAGYTELASPTANGGQGWEPIGWGNWEATPIGIRERGEVFKGTLDGQGYEIRDLYINSQGQVGLFGFISKGGIITKGGIIKNITLINATVTTGEDSGGQLELNEDTMRCLDVASVWGVGVLAGYNGGTMSNCYATGNITGDSGVGGLVGYNEGTVSNCYAMGNITGDSGVGGLVGYNDKGIVSNCYSTGTVRGEGYVGGLVGDNEGTVSNSYYNYGEVLINGENVITIGALFSGDFEEWLANGKFLDINDKLSQENGYYVLNSVTDFKELLAFGQDDTLKFRLMNDLDLAGEPNFYIPYLAGEFDGNGHKISNLSFSFDFADDVGLFGYLALGGKVSGLGIEHVNITADWCVGGLIGLNYYGTVSNCYATGSVTGNSGVGGLVGRNEYKWGNYAKSIVRNSYFTGSVIGVGHVGGLVGIHYYGTLINCYATGNVTSPQQGVGGLVGWKYKGTVSNSFWDIETSGQSNSAGGTGKTTAEMHDVATFSEAGWDIIAVGVPGERNTSYIWNIVDGVTYPFLSWQPV
jgi:hypothetical protein